jgi:hypothetical protein
MGKRNTKVRRWGEGKINLPQSPVGSVCTRGPKPSTFIKIEIKIKSLDREVTFRFSRKTVYHAVTVDQLHQDINFSGHIAMAVFVITTTNFIECHYKK